ncbi:UDP-N-acetylmuramoyl-L-alanyl-D-glutamate--2,6-diaminopimelate ligase [Oceanobacillus rekensis]|uniref:UDP-N-acetylmuramoyl-L-alanyl-D-glutamate--2, 6-diaminopimelate ligase n=1 Tax=Oceanobacillus rekensis TaxID=937927 RepID=UPI000B434B3B|nr:UDP-N-acetylmuramoyl-L-alanyl-D-glutamate--2,6-diaminopimelate ligase [Oceanobacillus rekensis]
MNTYELLDCLKMKEIHGNLPDKIDALYDDSRKVDKNSLFICIRGYTVDGHDYYSEAINNGATLIIAEEKLDIGLNHVALVVVKDTSKALSLLACKFYDYPSRNLNIYGITGTNGKTTVASLINHVLKSSGYETALAGTNGSVLVDEYNSSPNTTCDALTNQQMIKKACDLGIRNMVMEVSSHGLAQGRLWGVEFDIVTFTNLTQDHLDYHDTMHDYGYIKGLLFAHLGTDLTKEKYVILNKDDAWFQTYAVMAPVEVISYGIHSDAHFKAENITTHEHGTNFTLLTPHKTFELNMHLLGEFNVYNALAAITSLYAKGEISLESIVEYIQEIKPVSGRMEKVKIDSPISIYLDYAHTPDAIEKAIKTVLPFKKNKLIFVAGTGGDRDELKRPLMGEKASAADFVILTVNDPRFEDPVSILYDMEKGMRHHNYTMIPDRKEAIHQAIDISEPGDIVIIAGKGQEDYQIIGNKKQPHSDMKIALEKCSFKYNFKV